MVDDVRVHSRRIRGRGARFRRRAILGESGAEPNRSHRRRPPIW
nr:hypothetical protein JVH1_7909 [Rhodococcus sp. JVH1]